LGRQKGNETALVPVMLLRRLEPVHRHTDGSVRTARVVFFDGQGAARGSFVHHRSSGRILRMTVTPNDPAAGPLVLVIDDEEAVRSVIGRLLSRQGYRVLLAQSGEEGLRLHEEHANDIRLVVLDWHLPGVPGERTFDELLARDSKLRVVLVTGDHEAELGANARQYLACMLLKPFTTAELTLAVNTVIAA
jgi:CheY-like chemotaxis protein